MTALRIATALLLVGFPAATGGSMLHILLVCSLQTYRCRWLSIEGVHILVKFVQVAFGLRLLGKCLRLSFRGMGRQHA
jgi:hypothetical protein